MNKYKFDGTAYHRYKLNILFLHFVSGDTVTAFAIVIFAIFCKNVYFLHINQK